MAADAQFFVNAASAAGGDGTTNATSGANRAFNSVDDALAARFAVTPDLTAADIRLILDCEGTTADDENIQFASYQFTSNYAAGQYVLIRAQGAHRHAGVYSTSAFRLLPSSINNILGVSNVGCDVVFDGIQINMTGSLASNPIAFSFLNNGTNRLHLKGCIVRSTGTGTPSGSAAITGTGTSGRRLYMENCLVDGPFFQGVQLNFLSGSGRCVIYYCTFVGIYRNGIAATDASSGRVFLKNNRVDTLVSPGQSFSLSGTTATSGANYTADAFSPQDGTYENKTFTWAGGGSYLLAGADGFVGADLAADAELPVSTDVLGNTRTTFYAGFHEFGGSAGPSYHDGPETILSGPYSTGGGGGVARLVGGGLAG
jgi:hypothetical protein